MYLDVVVFYLFIGLLIFVCALAAVVGKIYKFLHYWIRIKIWKFELNTSVGEISLAILFGGLTIWWVWYWGFKYPRFTQPFSSPGLVVRKNTCSFRNWDTHDKLCVCVARLFYLVICLLLLLHVIVVIIHRTLAHTHTRVCVHNHPPTHLHWNNTHMLILKASLLYSFLVVWIPSFKYSRFSLFLLINLSYTWEFQKCHQNTKEQREYWVT